MNYSHRLVLVNRVSLFLEWFGSARTRREIALWHQFQELLLVVCSVSCRFHVVVVGLFVALLCVGLFCFWCRFCVGLVGFEAK
jgi:hypothetical protein